MSENTQMTHIQHYISKMYLRQFSASKTSLYRYNINDLNQPSKLRSLDKICREKDLYELIHEDGTYIATNKIENNFGRIEASAGKVIKSIKIKMQNEQCLKCATVLSENDKAILTIFITTLLYRDPQTIEIGVSFLQKTNPDLSIREARNFTLMNLLPLGLDAEWDGKTIIRTAIKRLCGMAFQIGISDEDVIITSDRPVVLWPPTDKEQYDRPRAVAFPLTSRLVLYLFPFENVEPIGRNCFIKLNDRQIHDIQYNVAVCARKWVFSKNPLTEEQLKRIRKARSG